MDNFDVYQVLGYGVIGLGAVLAGMAFRLLSAEQKRDTPRKLIMHQINIFIVFSGVICLIGGAAEITKNMKLKAVQQEAKTYQQDAETAKTELASANINLAATQQQLESHASYTRDLEVKLTDLRSEIAASRISPNDKTRLLDIIPKLETPSISIEQPSIMAPEELPPGQ